MKTIALIGTFDSKGEEFKYVKELLESLGNQVFLINTGVFSPTIKPDIDVEIIVHEMNVEIENIRTKNDRAFATEVLAKGVEKLLPKLYQAGKFDGVLSFGGTCGTSIVTPGMRQLPIGVPKMMVSTVASGDTSAYIGTSDIIMVPSIVDVSGLNKVSRMIYKNAVSAISGMVNTSLEETIDDKPLIAASMFGVTTPSVNQSRKILEDSGYEVLVFHATGVGGKTMESLIEAGYFEGVLDLTLTELADELVGGTLSAGPNRLEAASHSSLPQVVSLGALDMVNFGPYETVPKQFSERNLYKHNPTITLMRTTVDENKQLGKIIATKLNQAKEKTILLLPLQGVSSIDVKGQPFYSPDADQMLIQTIKEELTNPNVKVIELDTNINDPSFSELAARSLISMIKGVDQ